MPRIAVIDDDPLVFETLKATLARESYDLRYFPGGTVALDTLIGSDTDLVLLDLMMPGMDGTRVCRLLRERPDTAHLPIIMVTALDTKRDLARSLEAGADDFVTKPVSGIELRARIRSMLRIKQQYDALSAALKVREDLSNMVVHDLRTPLSIIRLCGDYLVGAARDEVEREMAASVVAAARRISSMADAVLMVAKMEAGKLLLAPAETDLCRLAESVVAVCQPLAKPRNLTLRCEVPEEPVVRQADPHLIERVLENLISNAVKFSPERGVVTVSVEAISGGRVRVGVADEGAGVPAELKERLFGRFESGKPGSGQLGVGLGLAFCAMAVRAHGGTIEVLDREPTGSVFAFDL